VTVIAALDDPVAILVTDDFHDMVRPHDDGSDRRAAGIGTVVGPGASEIILRAGIAADQGAHIPSAPCGRPPTMGISPAVSVVM